MDNIIKKTNILIEAFPYIRNFRNEIIVVKFGGSAMEDSSNARGVLEDVAFMECVGMKPVIVHGGGKAISRGMQKHGINSNFVDGFRVTCEKTIEVVKNVLKNEVNPSLVSILKEYEAKAECLDGEKVFNVVKKAGVDKDTGNPIDWGFVGEPKAVNVGPIEDLLKNNIIPVITPLGMGDDGKIHNINADTAAGAVAKALKARKIAFISDVPGLLRDANDPTSLMATLNASAVEDLIKHGVISGGMLPKIESGVEALHAGVKKIHMIDGHMRHSLLLEIFTDKGVGTEIVEI